MSWVKRTIIIQSQDQAMAQNICSTLAGESGAGMFTTELSPTGAAPATAYVSSGMIQDNFAAILGDANQTFGACQQAGLPYTLQQITDMYSRATISDADDPMQVIADAGLQFVNPNPV